MITELKGEDTRLAVRKAAAPEIGSVDARAGSSNTRRALALVHGMTEENRLPSLGTLLPALRRRGFEVTVVAADDEGVPMPRPDDYQVLVVMGSHDSVYDDHLTWIARERDYLLGAVDAGIPVFGICFGAQMLAHLFGGTVQRGELSEHGLTVIDTRDPDLVGAGPWLEFHHDAITAPASADVVATTAAGVQAFTVGPHMGVQFHPEASPAWLRAWSSSIPDLESYLASHGLDLASFTDSVGGDTDISAAVECDVLFGRFLERAGIARPSRPMPGSVE